jgi:hypothetical protein
MRELHDDYTVISLPTSIALCATAKSIAEAHVLTHAAATMTGKMIFNGIGWNDKRHVPSTTATKSKTIATMATTTTMTMTLTTQFRRRRER